MILIHFILLVHIVFFKKAVVKHTRVKLIYKVDDSLHVLLETNMIGGRASVTEIRYVKRSDIRIIEYYDIIDLLWYKYVRKVTNRNCF